MALVDGNLIKTTRLKRNFNQVELAQGICKQATISNIERKNFCKDIVILSKICRKLSLSLSDVIQASPEDWIDDQLTLTEEKIRHHQFKEAYSMLKELKQPDITDELLKRRYYYAYGVCILTTEKNLDDALFYFNQTLLMTTYTDQYSILANIGLASLYEKKGQLDFANTYYEKALKDIPDIKTELPLSFNQVYLAAAIFYRSLKDFKKAIQLCQVGIQLNQSYHSTELLDELFYEVYLNEKKLNGITNEKLLATAFKLAEFNNNKALLKQLNKA